MAVQIKCINYFGRVNSKLVGITFVLRSALLCLTTLLVGACVSGSLEKKTKGDHHSASTLRFHELTTFDVYVDNNTIHLLTGGKVTAENKRIELHYIQSNDGGISWSKPVVVAKPAATINNRGNDIQLAANGDHLLALWQTKGELPGMGPLASAYSTDGGNTWVSGKNPAINGAGDQSHSDLIAGQNGQFHAVWLEDPEENGYQSLHYARSMDDGEHWEKAMTLDGSTCSCCWNTLALSPNNELNIYYRDMKPRDMALIRSVDGGLSWQRISTVGTFGWQFDGCPHVGGALVYGNDNPNRLHALSWTGLEGKSGLYFLTSDDDGQHWSMPHLLGKEAFHGDIAAYQGELIAIWDEMETAGSAIYYATSGDNGKAWSPAIKLSQPNHNATHPRLAATANGILALWTEKSGKIPSRMAWLQIKP